MKRAIMLFLCATILLGAFTVSADAGLTKAFDISMQSDDVKEAVGFLSAVGVVGADIQKEADFNRSVTRLEYAHMLAKLMNLEAFAVDTTYFKDVKDDAYINALAEAGIFKGETDGLFYPDSKITAEAVLITGLRALGYEKLYNIMGANTNVLVQLIRRAGLNGYISINDNVNLEKTLCFLMQLAKANILEPKTFSTDGQSDFTNVGTETLMELKHDLYYTEGKVTANGYTSLQGDSGLDKKQLEINNYVYDTDISDAYKYIGQTVHVYYEYDSKTIKRGKIISIYAPENKNDALVVDAKNVQGYSMGKFTYYDEAAERSITLDVSGIDVIYNWKAETRNYENLFDFEIGTVSLYKNDKGKYDVAIIEEIRNLNVLAMDQSTYTMITDATEPKDAHLKKLVLDIESDRNIIVKHTSSGYFINPIDLRPEDHVSIIASADGEIVEVYLCAGKVSGKLDSQTSGTNSSVTVNGEKYDLPTYAKIEKGIAPGVTVSLYFDTTGNVGWIDASGNDDGTFIAYAYKGGKTDKAFSTDYKIKIFTENSEHIVANLSDKVNFNGQTKEASVVLTALCKDDGSFIPQIMRCRINGKGEINFIDTAAPSLAEAEGEGTLNEVCPFKKNTYYLNADFEYIYHIDQSTLAGQKKYGLIPGETKVLIVPDAAVIDTAEEDEFAVATYTKNGLFTRAYGIPIGLYNTDFNDPYGHYAVYAGEKIFFEQDYNINFANVVMVEDIYQVLDEESNSPMYEIKGYRHIMPITLRLTDDCVVKGRSDNADMSGDYSEVTYTISDIEPGDLITVTENIAGEVYAIKQIFDCDKEKPYWGDDIYKPSSSDLGGNASGRYAYGNVAYLYRGQNDDAHSLIKMVEPLGIDQKAEGKIAKEYIVFKPSKIRIIVFDSSKNEQRISIGSINDIMDAETDDKEQGDKIFIYKLIGSTPENIGDSEYYRALYLWK